MFYMIYPCTQCLATLSITHAQPLCFLDPSHSLAIIAYSGIPLKTIGTKIFVRYSEVSLAQGSVVDHAHPTIVASYDKALL